MIVDTRLGKLYRKGEGKQGRWNLNTLKDYDRED